MENSSIYPDTVKSLKHQELITLLRYKIRWMHSTAKEIHRLYKTNTIRSIRRSDVPKGRKVTYGSFEVDKKNTRKKRNAPGSHWEEIRSNALMTNLAQQD
jgi:hypothetical protein